MVAYDTGCIRVMGLIYGDVSWGQLTGIGAMKSICGGRAMGTHVIGWIGAMGLIDGDM